MLTRILVLDVEREPVFQVLPQYHIPDPAAVAAEIVRACNAHDALLAACKFWLGAVQNSLALRLALTGLPEGAGPALVEMLQEAIAAAEGESEAQ